MNSPFFNAYGVIVLHDYIVKTFGGLTGIHSKHALEASLFRPFSGLSDGSEFFPTVFDKAAVLLSGIISNHPFVDGNKRTAIALTQLFLMGNLYDWHFNDDEIVDFAVNIAENKLKHEEIKEWIVKRSKREK